MGNYGGYGPFGYGNIGFGNQAAFGGLNQAYGPAQVGYQNVPTYPQPSYQQAPVVQQPIQAPVVQAIQAPAQQPVQPQGQAFTSSVGYQQQYASPSYQSQAQGYVQGQAYTGSHEYQQYATQSYQAQPQAYSQASNYGEVNQAQPYPQPATYTAAEESVPGAAVNQATY